MAALGMELVLGWTPAAVSARVGDVTAHIADRLRRLDVPVLADRFRSPHILGVRLPDVDAATAVAGLEARGVFVSDRHGTLRISPHVWADESDVAQFGDALAAVVQRAR